MGEVTATTLRVTTIRELLGTGGRLGYGILGGIIFALGLYLLFSGVMYGTNGGSGYFAQTFLEWLVILSLFLAGVVDILSGISRAEGASSGARGARFGIGLVVIVLAIIAIWPVAFGTTVAGLTAFTFLWLLVATAFTLEGIFLMLVGALLDGWQRALAIGIGVIVLVFGILSWIYPNFATFVVWSVFSIALLAFGLRCLVVAGTGVRVRKFSSVSGG